jgi:hypothetical protein
MPRHPPCALNNLTTQQTHNTTPHTTSDHTTSQPTTRPDRTPSTRRALTPARPASRHSSHQSHAQRGNNDQDARVHYAIHKQQTANQHRPATTTPTSDTHTETSRGRPVCAEDRSCSRGTTTPPRHQPDTTTTTTAAAATTDLAPRKTGAARFLRTQQCARTTRPSIGRPPTPVSQANPGHRRYYQPGQTRRPE